MTPLPPAERTALWSEIREQPAAARRALEKLAAGATARRAALAGRLGGEVVLTGAGTSRHAAEAAAATWRRDLGLAARAAAVTGFDAAGEKPSAIVAITQSGATGSVLRLLREAGRQSVFRVVVTNAPESEAAERADLTLVTPAGPERAIPATKSFTSALVALLALGRDWAAAGGTAPAARLEAADRVAAAAPGLLAAAVAQDDRISRFGSAAARPGPWFFLGGAGLRPLAREGALKMAETAVVPAMELPAGELAHGPAALLTPETPVVVVSGDARPGPAEARSLEAARSAGAPVVRIAPGPAPARPAARETGVDLPAPAEAVGAPAALAFFAAPLLQLLAFHTGRQLGRDVDRPPRLGKAVGDD